MGKLGRAVLRGRGDGNITLLPDHDNLPRRGACLVSHDQKNLAYCPPVHYGLSTCAAVRSSWRSRTPLATAVLMSPQRLTVQLGMRLVVVDTQGLHCRRDTRWHRHLSHPSRPHLAAPPGGAGASVLVARRASGSSSRRSRRWGGRSRPPLGRPRAASATWRGPATWSPGASDTWSNSTHRRRTIRHGSTGAWQTCRSAQRHLPIIPPSPPATSSPSSPSSSGVQT